MILDDARFYRRPAQPSWQYHQFDLVHGAEAAAEKCARKSAQGSSDFKASATAGGGGAKEQDAADGEADGTPVEGSGEEYDFLRGGVCFG